MSRVEAVVSVLLSCVLATSAVASASEAPRVVIIGFDGADATLVERWMDEGELPNLAALRDEGTFAPLLPTNPPQTPVSWSSFATGTNPGKTEIFDFLNRDPSSYLPDFAMISESKQPFLFGDRNGRLLGTIAAGALFALVLAATLLVRLRWWARLVLAALPAIAVGAVVAQLADELLPREVPIAINNRKGETMWSLVDAAGKRARVIRVPATFPAEPLERGRLVSGLGVPDMRGTIGKPAYYTSDPRFDSGDNEFSIEVVRLAGRRGRIKTRVFGPTNKPFYAYEVERRLAASGATDPRERRERRREIRAALDDAGVPERIDLPLEIEADDDAATIVVDGQRQRLEAGDWSDWVTLRFPVNGLIDRVEPLTGAVRFRLLALEPELELYMSPINFHPDCHPIAHSWPPEHSEELLDRFGMYKTLGWAIDTWSLPSGIGDERHFLEDMRFTVAKYREMMRGLLVERDDLYVQIFYFTDRIGHLYWRFLDEGHPLHDPQEAARHRGEMLEAYRTMDEIVGEARALAGEDAIFIVCSDHGFSSFRRGVNYNNWLIDNGLMTLTEQPAGKATLEQLFETRKLFEVVDWSKTKAYAMGLGSVYVNLAGREKQGIVLPGPEYDAVRRQIKQGLEAIVDPETGERPVTRVYLREEIYTAFDESLIPDLRVANNLNYRVSWQTSLGGFGETLIEDNTKPWSGDHCSNDPELVKGIFFINRPITTDAPRMIDVMPTVLDALDLEIPASVDGRSLL